MSPKLEGVVLAVLHDEMEAAILRGLLERAGIRSALRRANFAAGAGHGAPYSGPLEIVVDERDLGLARQLVGRRR